MRKITKCPLNFGGVALCSSTIMSKQRRFQGTSSEKSSWTPKSYAPSNKKIYEERIALIKKWYAAWNEEQKWALLEFILLQLPDEQLELLHTLLQPSMPPPVLATDFTRCLPRILCLRIFALLDPQSLCRAAQVCWYWKYLAEANEIWQNKCLRQGWFLPAPPPHHDYLLWKRHYIACVCQLHWNPPQPPSNDEAEDGEDNNIDDITSNAPKEKKKLLPRHKVKRDPRKPWKDPDPCPTETHFIYGAESPMYYRDTMVENGDTDSLQQPPHPASFITATTATTILMQPTLLIPTPTSLLHPTLLEKMRLQSPSPAHMHLSARNKQQTESEISETLFKLQSNSPFPKLPPYFVHKTKPEVAVGESGDTLQPLDNKKTEPEESLISGSRGSEVTAPSKSSKKITPENVHEGLLTRAWAIPKEDP